MNRIEIIMEGLHRAVPTGTNTQYSREKWRSVAEVIDSTLLEYESQPQPDIEDNICHVIAYHDGANPRSIAQEIVKELQRIGHNEDA